MRQGKRGGGGLMGGGGGGRLEDEGVAEVELAAQLRRRQVVHLAHARAAAHGRSDGASATAWSVRAPPHNENCTGLARIVGQL